MTWSRSLWLLAAPLSAAARAVAVAALFRAGEEGAAPRPAAGSRGHRDGRPPNAGGQRGGAAGSSLRRGGQELEPSVDAGSGHTG